MRLGDRPDPAADRARGFLHRVRDWFDRRKYRIALVVLLLLIAGTVLVGLIVVVDDDPTISNPPERVVALILHRVGLDREDIFLIAAGIKYVNIGLPENIIRGMLSKPEQIVIDIAELDFQRLAYEREIALKQGYWIPTDADLVPITIHYRNQTLHGKARLKGDNPDHYYGEKWSLRINLDGDEHLDHMGEFGIEAPRTRNYMAEWLYQQALAREGVPGIAYRFVDVTINGKHMGTYGLEEEFDEGITWYNREPPGPILRFSTTGYHWSIVEGNRMPDPERTVPLAVVNKNATKSGFSENETAAAIRLLEQWRRGEIPTRDAFDVEKTARYFALSDLFGNLHGDLIHNIRFYYNTVSARLEPVGYDANAGIIIEEIKGVTTNPYYRLFFDDPVLMEAYLFDLERISAPGYLESLFSETETALQANASIIYRDQPYYYFSHRPYIANRATIRNTLHPYRAISAYINGTTAAGPLIELGASQPVPVEVTGLRIGDLHGVPEGGAIRLAGKALYEPVQFRTVAFAFPEGTAWNTSAPMKIECRVLGTDEPRLESVVSTPRLPGTDVGRLTRLPANTDDLAFAVTDDANRTVFLVPGSHRITEPLVVPEGYTFLCGPGTRLDLVQNASIIVRGPLDWEGTEEAPIMVGSSDGTGGGVAVLSACNTSTLINVHFDPLASSASAAESGTVLTFLESPAVLDRVSVKGDRTTPLLRLIGGQFIITGSAFIGRSAPAIGVEYSKGNLTGTLISGGSGLTVSGSVVELERDRFERITGPAVLAQRGSTISGTDVACAAADTGLAAESGSIASLEGLTVRDADVGVRASGGEAGFEPAHVALAWPTVSNVTTPYVQEDGGTITVDGGRPAA